MKETINEAEEFIERMADISLGEAYERLLKEKNGEGCGCLRCKQLAVREMNEIVNWISKNQDPIEWYVDEDGQIKHKMDYGKLDNLMK